MAKDFIDFVNTTGKNIGQLQNTKLAAFLGVSEGAIRSMKRKEDQLRLDCLYLGALCKANNISKENLVEISKQNKE